MKTAISILSNDQVRTALARFALEQRRIEPDRAVQVEVLHTYRMVDGKATPDVLQTRVEVTYEEESWKGS